MPCETESLEILGQGPRQLLPRLTSFPATPGASGTFFLGAGGEGLGTAPHVGIEADSPGGGCPPAEVGATCLSRLPLLSLVGEAASLTTLPSIGGRDGLGEMKCLGKGPRRQGPSSAWSHRRLTIHLGG